MSRLVLVGWRSSCRKSLGVGDDDDDDDDDDESQWLLVLQATMSSQLSYQKLSSNPRHPSSDQLSASVLLETCSMSSPDTRRWIGCTPTLSEASGRSGSRVQRSWCRGWSTRGGRISLPSCCCFHLYKLQVVLSVDWSLINCLSIDWLIVVYRPFH